MKSDRILKLGILTLVITLTVTSRINSHSYNFSSITALALFGAAYYSNRKYAYVVPIATVWISDLIINNIVNPSSSNHVIWFENGTWITYSAIILITYLGTIFLRKVTLLRLFFISILSSLLFFLFLSLEIWLYSNNIGIISHSLGGQIYLKDILLKDYFCIFLIFGLYEIFIKQIFHYINVSRITDKKEHFNI